MLVKFKQYSTLSTDIKDPLYLENYVMKRGEWLSMTIDKSLVKCNVKLAAISCRKYLSGNCNDYLENVIEELGCVEKMPYDEMAYFDLTITDTESIPPFVVYTEDDIDIFTFEGGTLDELLLYGNIEVTSFGVRMYFDKRVANNTIVLKSNNEDSIYTTFKKFCYNRSTQLGINFCFKENGCYRLALIDPKEPNIDKQVKAISGSIKVVSTQVRGILVSYTRNSFYYRHRLPIELLDSNIEVEEEETILSDGSINIKTTAIRKTVNFTTHNIKDSELVEIVYLLKNGVKIGTDVAVMRGGIDKTNGKKKGYSTGRGTLYLKSNDIITASNCESGCSKSSSFSFRISEKEKNVNVINLI